MEKCKESDNNQNASNLQPYVWQTPNPTHLTKIRKICGQIRKNVFSSRIQKKIFLEKKLNCFLTVTNGKLLLLLIIEEDDKAEGLAAIEDEQLSEGGVLPSPPSSAFEIVVVKAAVKGNKGLFLLLAENFVVVSPTKIFFNEGGCGPGKTIFVVLTEFFLSFIGSFGSFNKSFDDETVCCLHNINCWGGCCC